MNAVNHVSDIRLATHCLGVRQANGPSRDCEVDSRRSHRPEDRVVFTDRSGEPLVAAEPWVELSRGPIDRAASMLHGEIEIVDTPIVDRLANALTDACH